MSLQIPWHNSPLFRLYFALNAIWILDSAYTRRWNVTEIEKLSIKLKVSDDWKLVYCRIYFKSILNLCSFSFVRKMSWNTLHLVVFTENRNIDTAYTLKNLDIAYTCSEAVCGLLLDKLNVDAAHQRRRQMMWTVTGNVLYEPWLIDTYLLG
jgi:hypothetical protein